MPIPPDILDIACKLALAMVLGGLLGLERERKRRAAGLRTHIVVCLASTLAIIISNHMANEWLADVPAGPPMDRGRIVAGILQGMGFIGAGAIINVGNIHRGLTTAAMIWFVAVLGVAIGMGYYVLAIGATAFALAAVLLLEPFSEWLSASPEFSLGVQLPGGPQRVHEVESFIEKQGYRVHASQLTVRETGETLDMRFSIGATRKGTVETLIESLNDAFKDIRQISVER